MKENTAEMAGGGIYSTESEPELFNCSFERNNANSSGGGIAYMDSGAVKIRGCMLWDNTAASNGGGIAIENSGNVKIFDGKVAFNKAGGDGGGIAIMNSTKGSSILIWKIIVGINNTDSNGGGIALINSGDVEIEECLVAYNTATLYGGGIAIMDSTADGTVVINETIIGGNVTYSSGGGVAYWGGLGELRITDKCDIILNTAAQHGGGIAFLESNDAYVLDSIVRLNTAGWSGGGIACIDTVSEIDIIDCGIGFNTAGRDGGGLANDGSYVICDGNVIAGNKAGWNGGGVSWTNDFSGKITLCGIVYNKAALSGGGVYYNSAAYKQKLTAIYKCLMIANTAGGDGGGIACENADNLEIERCYLISCTAGGMGGAIRFKDSSILVSDCILYKNTAVSGGGIYCTGKGNATIRACEVKNNQAVNPAEGGGGFGGGIALDDYLGEHTFSDSSITDNVAADAGVMSLFTKIGMTGRTSAPTNITRKNGMLSPPAMTNTRKNGTGRPPITMTLWMTRPRMDILRRILLTRTARANMEKKTRFDKLRHNTVIIRRKL